MTVCVNRATDTYEKYINDAHFYSDMLESLNLHIRKESDSKYESNTIKTRQTSLFEFPMEITQCNE